MKIFSAIPVKKKTPRCSTQLGLLFFVLIKKPGFGEKQVHLSDGKCFKIAPPGPAPEGKTAFLGYFHVENTNSSYVAANTIILKLKSGGEGAAYVLKTSQKWANHCCKNRH